MSRDYDFVFIGLSLSSSWGNGHATTFRALIRALKRQGYSVLFLERDKPWFADHRDMAVPDFCTLRLYDEVSELESVYAEPIRRAAAVVIGSFVPDGVEVIDRVAALAPRCLCFYDIDTPVTLGMLDGGNEEFLARRQVPLFDIYFSFTGGPTLSLLEKRYGAKSAVALYCSVDTDRYRDTNEPTQWDLGYLGTYSDDRQPTLERLLIEPARRLPQMRFVVAGAQYPGGIDWPENVERIDHVPPDEHASFYSRQRFTLNVTRQNMIRAGWSPSVRLFEAAACRTPVISDDWQGLDELLPDRQAILIAHSSDDVVAILSQTGAAERDRIARNAASIIGRDHTSMARAAQFLAAIPKVSERSPGARWAKDEIGARETVT